MAETPPKSPEITATGKPSPDVPGLNDYAMIVGKQAVQTEAVYSGIGKTATVISATAPLTPVFSTVAKRAPVIGAVISAGQALQEIKGDIGDSKYAKAGVASVAGVVEVIGNLAGFGVGDSAREVVRSAAISLGGPQVEIQKSDLRAAAETVGQSAAAHKNSTELEQIRQQDAYRTLVGKDTTHLLKVEGLVVNMGMTVLKPPKR